MVARCKLEKWAHMNLMKFYTAKDTVLHLGQGNPRRRIHRKQPCRVGLGISMDEKPTMGQ